MHKSEHSQVVGLDRDISHRLTEASSSITIIFLVMSNHSSPSTNMQGTPEACSVPTHSHEGSSSETISTRIERNVQLMATLDLQLLMI